MKKLIPWKNSLHGKQIIQWSYVRSSVGYCLVSWVNEGICSLSLHPLKSHKTMAVADLKRRFADSQFQESKSIPLWTDLDLALQGEEPDAPIPLVLKGTDFQLKVWKALNRVPVSTTTSYKELAEAVGSPRAFRAVGSAVGANPIGVLIPCHRVLRSDNGIGGFRWGLEAKRKLLQAEGISSY